jgi:hypothetical protein
MVNSGPIGPTSVRQTISFECQHLINRAAGASRLSWDFDRRAMGRNKCFFGTRCGVRDVHSIHFGEDEGPFGTENYAAENKGQGYSRTQQVRSQFFILCQLVCAGDYYADCGI